MMGFSSIGKKIMPSSNMSRIVQIKMKSAYGRRLVDYRVNLNRDNKWLRDHPAPSRLFLHWIMHNQAKLLAAAQYGIEAALMQGIEDRDANVTAALLATQVVIRDGRLPNEFDMKEIFTQAKRDRKILSTELLYDYQVLLKLLRNKKVDVSPFLHQGNDKNDQEKKKRSFKKHLVSLGALVSKAQGGDIELKEDMTSHEAVKLLSYLGIKTHDYLYGKSGKSSPTAEKIWIARNHKSLINILQNTQFEAIDYSKVLKSAPTARSVDSVLFANCVCRAVEMSLSDFMQNDTGHNIH